MAPGFLKFLAQCGEVLSISLRFLLRLFAVLGGVLFGLFLPDLMHPLGVEATVVYEDGVVVGGTGVVDNRDQCWGRRVELSVV